jgi:hypothetical protein
MNDQDIILIVIAIVIVFTIAILLPILVWLLRLPFLWLNYLQWFLMAPIQHLMRNYKSDWSYGFYIVTTPLRIIYGIIAYLLLTPVRFINALYFNIILYWTVVYKDSVIDIIHPRHGFYKNRSSMSYFFCWIFFLPFRSLKILLIYPWAIFQGIATTIFDIIWPTLTMFHGTSYEHAASTIAYSGVWYVGYGNYAGTGIYFGLLQGIAEHYARNAKGTPCIIVARVTLSLCRPISTLPKHLRQKVGNDGDFLSNSVNFPYASLEHWRTDLGYYEFCLVQSRKDTFINTWRIRPICIIDRKSNNPLRVYGGLTIWPGKVVSGWIVLILTIIIFLFLSSVIIESRFF